MVSPDLCGRIHEFGGYGTRELIERTREREEISNEKELERSGTGVGGRVLLRHASDIEPFEASFRDNSPTRYLMINRYTFARPDA